MGKMLETFGPELSSDTVQAFIRGDGNLVKFNSFFKGDGSGRMFIFYQSEVSEGEVSCTIQ
jgi:hypothetical protein